MDVLGSEPEIMATEGTPVLWLPSEDAHCDSGGGNIQAGVSKSCYPLQEEPEGVEGGLQASQVWVEWPAAMGVVSGQLCPRLQHPDWFVGAHDSQRTPLWADGAVRATPQGCVHEGPGLTIVDHC